MNDTAKGALFGSVRRALVNADDILLAELNKATGIGRQMLERIKATGVSPKGEAQKIAIALETMGHHDRAAHIHAALKGKD